MRRLSPRLASGIIVFLAAGTVPAEAQEGQLILTPQIGLYVPIGVRVEDYSTSGELDVLKRQLSALFIGASARVGGEHLGVEASAGVVPFSWVAVSRDRTTTDINSAVLLAALKGVLSLTGSVGPGDWGFQTALGVGGVGRSGAGWSTADPRSALAVIIGAGGSIGFTGVPLRIRLDLDDYVSRAAAHPHDPAGRQSRLHHDLIWSLGLSVPIEGH